MPKKPSDLSALSEKIAHKSTKPSVYQRFKNADEVLGVTNNTMQQERVIRKSYALTKKDIENLKVIKEKCLNKRVVINDSHIIRLAINLTAQLSEEEIIKATKQIPKILTGRPKLH